MVRLLFSLILVACFGASTLAQEKPAAPSGNAPEIMLAQATEKDGGIVVKFSKPQVVTKQITVEVEKDGKKVKEFRTVEEYIWFDIDVKVDGEEVEVFAVDGKAIDPKDLLKRLAKPTQVAVMRFHPKIDPFYLKVLREDIVVFKGPLAKFIPPLPKK